MSPTDSTDCSTPEENAVDLLRALETSVKAAKQRRELERSVRNVEPFTTPSRLTDGYWLIHLDDVPERVTAEAAWGPAWAEGWNACRAHIFGGDDE